MRRPYAKPAVVDEYRVMRESVAFGIGLGLQHAHAELLRSWRRPPSEAEAALRERVQRGGREYMLLLSTPTGPLGGRAKAE
jgi:hypothetical protein